MEFPAVFSPRLSGERQSKEPSVREAFPATIAGSDYRQLEFRPSTTDSAEIRAVGAQQAPPVWPKVNLKIN